MTNLLLTEKQKFNFKHIYQDIFWMGILSGSTLSFISIYLARLGANPQHIGLLAAGPAFINLFISIPAGNYLKKKNLVKTTFWTSLFYRSGYLVLVPLPIIFSKAEQITAVIFIYLLAAIPGTILSISFNALFADMVEPEWRPTVVGRQNAILYLSMTLSSLFCGYLLGTLIFPLNYQVVFGMGAVGALMSSYHLSRFKPVTDIPKRVGRPMFTFAQPGSPRLGKSSRKIGGARFLTRVKTDNWQMLEIIKGPFGKLLLTYLIFNISQYVSLPLYSVYQVKNLGMSDGIISIATALFYAASLLFSLILSWWITKLGDKKAMQFSAMSYGLFPLMLAIWPGTAMFLVAHILGGMTWGLTGGSMTNHLMNNVPKEKRPVYMSLNHIVINVGILVGSFLGPVLADTTGIRNAILIGGILRVLAGIILGLWS